MWSLLCKMLKILRFSVLLAVLIRHASILRAENPHTHLQKLGFLFDIDQHLQTSLSDGEDKSHSLDANNLGDIWKGLTLPKGSPETEDNKKIQVSLSVLKKSASTYKTESGSKSKWWIWLIVALAIILAIVIFVCIFCLCRGKTIMGISVKGNRKQECQRVEPPMEDLAVVYVEGEKEAEEGFVASSIGVVGVEPKAQHIREKTTYDEIIEEMENKNFRPSRKVKPQIVTEDDESDDVSIAEYAEEKHNLDRNTFSLNRDQNDKESLVSSSEEVLQSGSSSEITNHNYSYKENSFETEIFRNDSTEVINNNHQKYVHQLTVDGDIPNPAVDYQDKGRQESAFEKTTSSNESVSSSDDDHDIQDEPIVKDDGAARNSAGNARDTSSGEEYTSSEEDVENKEITSNLEADDSSEDATSNEQHENDLNGQDETSSSEEDSDDGRSDSDDDSADSKSDINAKHVENSTTSEGSEN